MRTYCLFQAVNSPDLRAFTEAPGGTSLPSDLGPWSLVQEIGPDDEWTPRVSRAVVAAGIIENGFYLWGPADHAAPHAIVESDRVEGTAVFNRDFEQIGTVKRLLIEKQSGRVLYVDVTFGGFLGIGSHHITIPWELLAYDRELEGYRTDITEAQVKEAAKLNEGEHGAPNRDRERDIRDYWSNSFGL
jgi:hypothetical protein